MKDNDFMAFAETFAYFRDFTAFVKKKYPHIYDEYIAMDKKNDDLMELVRKKLREEGKR